MRAMLMNAQGGPDVLTVSDIPIPALTNPPSLLVKLHAAGVNPIDTKVRKHNMYYSGKLPSIFDCDGAGVVQATGNSVTRVRPDDEFFSTTASATCRELTPNIQWYRKIIWY